MRKVQTSMLLWMFAALAVAAQQPRATPAEIKRAEAEVPQLAKLLELKSSMTVADVGAGFGATTLALSNWLGPLGRIYATDIASTQLQTLKELVAAEHLANVVVVEGGAASTNLPDACCDAIVMQDVYHHITRPEEFDRSLLAALKSGGQLAIIDFEPAPGSALPEGVPANRGGHGIPPDVLIAEITAAGRVRQDPAGMASRQFSTTDLFPGTFSPSEALRASCVAR